MSKAKENQDVEITPELQEIIDKLPKAPEGLDPRWKEQHDHKWYDRLSRTFIFEPITGIYVADWNVMPEECTLTREQWVRLIKMRYSSFQSFLTREINNWAFSVMPTDQRDVRDLKQYYFPLRVLVEYVRDHWDEYDPFSYKELFEFENQQARAAMFRFADPSQMMEHLGAERYATAGKEVTYETGEVNNNIYELYKAKANKLDSNLEGDIYAVKVWCTSTNEEAWLWVEEEFADDPLRAIASTFRIHEDVIPEIKCLRRQGDILIPEMKDSYDNTIKPSGRIVPLTPDQYFGLLVMES